MLRFVLQEQTRDKVMIDTLHDKALNVSFYPADLKAQVVKHPITTGYVVSGKVHTQQGEPNLYLISAIDDVIN